MTNQSTVKTINAPLNFTGKKDFRKGKVRGVYDVGNELLVLHASNNITAFEHVFKETIPFKGQVLNQIASYMFDQANEACPSWILSNPCPTVSIGRKCTPFKFEVIVRGYLAGSAARDYKKGERQKCGVPLPEGLKENDKLPKPIVTPTTKENRPGMHDEDITPEEIINLGWATKEQWETIEKYALELFACGSAVADERGLILVDTKYEFGEDSNDLIRVIDEIHTPDSSRYFYKDTYEELQQKGLPQKQMSKEVFREWLIEQGFMGEEGQEPPILTEDVIELISSRYIELYERLTGQTFVPVFQTKEEIENSVNIVIAKLAA